MDAGSNDSGAGLDVYAPRFVADWLTSHGREQHRRLTGTLALADLSGFTPLTERLARAGKVGAELMSDTLDLTFGALLSVAFDDGADLIKWGGDSVLLLFQGTHHAPRAARAAHRMRGELRELVRRRALPVAANLRMSIGVHSGVFDAFLVGDPTSHRELILTGPDVTEIVALEAACGAGQIAVSGASAALLPRKVLGKAVAGLDSSRAHFLRSRPAVGDPADGADAADAADSAKPADPAGPTKPANLAGQTVDVSAALAPLIRSHLRASSGEPEHRPVAVGFVRFTGADAVWHDLGVEPLTRAVDEVVRNVQRACLDHDVTFFESDIDRDGGKIMLTAGAPRSTGNDSERLLRAARAIVDRPGILDVRVGVNRGHVFAGDFGPDFRRTYSIKGDAVNLAARLLGRAAPGEVIATSEVVSRSRTLVSVEQLDPFTVKGRAGWVRAGRVRGLVEGRAADHAEPPFTGRREELARLRGAVEATRGRRGSIIDVVGEPGIGKSRLVAELDLLPEDVTRLATTSGNYDSGTPYFTFRVLLRSLLGIGPHARPDAVARRLVDRVRDNAPELLAWLPLLGVPLDLDLPPTPQTQDLDPKFLRSRLEEVTVGLLTCLLPTPTVLIFEDAHLMDEASGGMLRRLEAGVADRPWCVIVTRREIPVGFVPSPTAAGHERIALGPLPDDDAIDLLEASAGGAALSVRAYRAMASRAAGNPLFLTSLATLARRTGETRDLPASVEAVLLSEIDRLDPSDRTLLRYAAVLGTRFDTRVLAEMFPDLVGHAGLVGRLAEFARPVADDVLEFRHSMVRDVAYAGLPFRLRRDMHERVALALERSAGETTLKPDLLSVHFHEAGHHDKAWTYSLQAGEHARSKYAYSEAVDFFERALDCAPHLPDLSAEARSAAYDSLGECRDRAGQSVAAISAFRHARRAVAPDVVATAELLYKEARVELRMGKFRQALGQLTRALHLLDGVEGSAADTVRARAATRYGFCRHLQGRPAEAVRWGSQGVRWAEASGDPTAMAHSYNALHLAYSSATREEDRPYGRLALEAYETLGDLSGQALCLNNLAIDDYHAGRWTQATETFARAAASFHRLGDDANEGNVTYNLGDVLVTQGRFEEALPVLRSALRLARGVDDQELVGLVLREGARAHAGTGNAEGAWQLFEQAREILDGLHLPIELALLDAAVAEALVRVDRLDEALTLLDEAIPQAVSRATDALARLHRVRASALAAAGRYDEAREQAKLGLQQPRGTYGGYEPALLRVTLVSTGAAGEHELAQAREVLDALGVISAEGERPEREGA